MPIVTCPTCQARYDPGLDEEIAKLKDMPGEVALKIQCPACGQWLRLPEQEPIDPPKIPKHMLDAMKAQTRLVGSDPPARRTRTPEANDRPRRRRHDADDEYEADADERPIRRRRDQAEDDYGDDPRPPRQFRQSRSDGLGIAALITGILAILICVLASLGACVCPFVIAGMALSLIAGVVAVILGFAGRARSRSGTNLAGITLGSISIVLSLAMIALIAAGIGFFAMNAPPPPANNPQIQPQLRPPPPPPPPAGPKLRNPQRL
jgi:hypothetical protein